MTGNEWDALTDLQRAKAVEGIISEVRYSYDQRRGKADNITWGSIENAREAFAIYQRLSPDPSIRQSCPSCHPKVFDGLREFIGLPKLSEEASKSEASRRLSICLKCPLLSSKTGLKGSFPWFRAKGNTCEACGCLVRAKVLLNGEKCPEGNW